MERGPDDDDEGAELDLPLGSPVHPDDRLWRHPSELASAGLPSAASPLFADPDPAPPAPPIDRPERRRQGRGFMGLWLPVILAGTVGALLSAGLITATGGFSRADLEAATATSSTVALAVTSRPAPPGLADLAERMEPSLLAVSGISADGRISRGSAIAIRSDHVVTAARLVVAFRDVRVLVQGIARKATLVGADPDTDLALLAVDGGGLVPATWGDAADLRPGDQAVAVSSAPSAEPGPTVTAGVVSGIARTLAYSGTELRGLLQIDRPVPPEGAGGALLDPDGALVGITLPTGPAMIPFGYAVPAEMASHVARQLLAQGRVIHPWLGVDGTDKAMNGGAEIQKVKQLSPAAEAGLEVGDVVVGLDGAAIPSMGMLLLELRLHEPGDMIRLVILRGGRELQFLLTLAERPIPA